MAQPQKPSHLCSACKALTFTQLRNGYKHPLKYRATVQSGKTCQLCRLIVCSMAKLQKRQFDAYKLEQRYDSMIETLPTLPAISRRELALGRGIPIVEETNLLSDLTWSRHEYRGEPNYKSEVRKGNFNEGETIQITAAENSLYQLYNYVPLRDIEPASSPRNHQMLRQWLEACKANHETCRSSRTGSLGRNVSDENAIIPARLIDVGSTEDLHPRPRLVETEEMQGKYLCLSHRWGREPNLQTKRCNLDMHKRGLPMNRMPPTFCDAFEVTRQLGYRYLWIDSLCILQDDDADWKIQSEKMGDIFESSSCTIAAVDAIDSGRQDHGLFLSRNSDALALSLILPFDKVPLVNLSKKVFKTKNPVYVWKIKWLKLESADRKHPVAERQAITLRPRVVSLYKKIRRSEWYNRGWVLQERVLSRRMIYYTKRKIYWSCLETTGEEEGGDPTGAVRDSLYSMISGSTKPHQFWTEIISEYVRCSITFQKDRLTAVGGLSQKLQRQFHMKINAGIPYEKDGNYLLWYTSDTPLRNFTDFHAPSWSWASLDGVVSFDLLSPSTEISSSLIRNVAFQTKTECAALNSNGECAGTCISGEVSFICNLGKLYRCGRLKEIRVKEYHGDILNNDDVMERILGSAVRSVGHPLRRFNADGIEILQTRQLFVPDHTELLMDKNSHILGFFIPDTFMEISEDTEITCTSIMRWGPCNDSISDSTSSTTSGSTTASQEVSVDFLGLQLVNESTGTYRRVGRGRIICNSWLSTCQEMRISIV